MDHQNSELCMCVMNVFSVKFVGLFVILLIGLSTVAEFWQLLADLSVPLVGCFLQLYVIRGTVVERRSLAGELSLSCAQPPADG